MDIQKSNNEYPKIDFWIFKNLAEFWISIIRVLDSQYLIYGYPKIDFYDITKYIIGYPKMNYGYPKMNYRHPKIGNK